MGWTARLPRSRISKPRLSSSGQQGYGPAPLPPRKGLAGPTIFLIVLVAIVLGGMSCVLCLALEQKPEPLKPLVASNVTPERACALMADIGFRSSAGWQGTFDPDYACTTKPKDLSGNSLVYSADGESRTVHHLKLELDILNRGEAAASQQVMANYCKNLLLRALGTPMPDALRRSIENAVNTRMQLGGKAVSVTREDYKTGRGYTLRFVIDL